MSSQGNEGDNGKYRAISRRKPALNGIRVQPAILDKVYPEYEVYRDFEGLAFGYLVYVYIDVPGGSPMLLQDAKISVRALRSLSPVINLAVTENGNDADLDHLALPPGDRQAYLNIFKWLECVLAAGRPDGVTIDCPGQLSDYHNMLHIAESLRIQSLIDAMRFRLGMPLQSMRLDRMSCPYCRFAGATWQ